MAKRPVPLYDFKAFGQAIKAARMERKESRKDVCDAMNLSPRYLANIENKGQQPSLQIFYELVTRYSISVDQFFFPNKDAEKNTQRRQLDTLLDGMSNDGLEIVTATAQKVVEVEKKTRSSSGLKTAVVFFYTRCKSILLLRLFCVCLAVSGVFTVVVVREIP